MPISDHKAEAPFPFPGIASARAFRSGKYFGSIPAESGAAFVVVTRRARERQKFLAEILSRHAELGVKVATDGLRVQSNKIYLLTPNSGLDIVDGRFRLRVAGPEHVGGAVVWPVGGKCSDIGAEGLSQAEIESAKTELLSVNEELLTDNHELRARVEELERANGELAKSLADAARSEERQRSLVAELNHRVQNMLMVVMAIGRQTLAYTASPEQFAQRFFDRLHAFSRAHELLSRGNWGEISFRRLALQALEPFVASDGDRIAVSGPEIMLSPPLALSFSLILDELATNAVKYGALSDILGRVSVNWSVSPGETDNAPVLRLTWSESGGPPAKPPKRQGLGMKIMKQEVEYSHFGVAEFTFADVGFSATFEVPQDAQKGAPQWQGLQLLL